MVLDTHVTQITPLYNKSESTVTPLLCTALQIQKGVTAYFKSKQLLSFVFVRQYNGHALWRRLMSPSQRKMSL